MAESNFESNKKMYSVIGIATSDFFFVVSILRSSVEEKVVLKNEKCEGCHVLSYIIRFYIIRTPSFKIEKLR